MEEKKKTFIAYLDDDNTIKKLWVDILEETYNYIIFKYHNDTLTIPFHRILKLKRVGDDNAPQ